MKEVMITTLAGTLTLSSALLVNGQGFMYDQESSTDETSLPPGQFPLQTQPFGDGQSFTPTFSSVGFIRLWVSLPGSEPGALVYANLRSGSISGAIIGTTTPVQLATGYTGTVNLMFATPIAVSPGTTYYFEGIANLSLNAGIGTYGYTGGSGIIGGTPESWDYWFREGTVAVPEPSAAALLVLAGCFFIVRRR